MARDPDFVIHRLPQADGDRLRALAQIRGLTHPALISDLLAREHARIDRLAREVDFTAAGRTTTSDRWEYTSFQSIRGRGDELAALWSRG